jgi:death-on-curing protein
MRALNLDIFRGGVLDPQAIHQDPARDAEEPRPELRAVAETPDAADGVRDEGMLASALAQPQQRFAYGSASLPELAASYAAGIVLNHLFLDGNKRTGFMLAATFLEVNGKALTATEEAVVERTVALASGSIEAAYAEWLREYS